MSPRSSLLAALSVSCLAAGCLEAPDYDVYDPSEEPGSPTEPVWLRKGDMHDARVSHVAVALSNGQVLVAGGYGEGGPTLRSAEIFDPGTGEWAPAGEMKRARGSFSGVLLPDGRVLVAGGTDLDGSSPPTYLDSAELYDPVSRQWQEVQMHRRHTTTTATVLPLPSGPLVLVVGGSGGYSKQVGEVFDPEAGSWVMAPAPVRAMHGHVAVGLGDDRVLLAGGYDPFAPFGDATIYDPVTGGFEPVPPMASARTSHLGFPMPGDGHPGQVLVVGGERIGQCPGHNEALATTEQFDPATGDWSQGPPLLRSRAVAAGVSLSSGAVVVVGGRSDDGCQPANPSPWSDLETLEPDAQGWVLDKRHMHNPRHRHTATLLRGPYEGRDILLVTGGYGEQDTYLRSTEMLHVGGTCEETSDCCAPPDDCAGVSCEDGGCVKPVPHQEPECAPPDDLCPPGLQCEAGQCVPAELRPPSLSCAHGASGTPSPWALLAVAALPLLRRAGRRQKS